MKRWTISKKKEALVLMVGLCFGLLSSAQTSHEETQRIMTFCKVWGFLKYHHPTVASGKLDWDKEFMSRIQVVSTLDSKEEVHKFYSEWIQSLGKVKKCRRCKSASSEDFKDNLDFEWLKDSIIFSREIINQLQFIHANRNQKKNHYVKYDKYIQNARFVNENPYRDSIYPSAELRLLGLSRFWNIIQYFYPSKYMLDTDWNDVLKGMIPKYRDAKDTISYHLAMLELTASINDSHSSFYTPYIQDYFGWKLAPFKFEVIDEKAIVKGYFNDSLCVRNDIKVGDAFLKVGDQTIEEIISNNAKYIGASNKSSLARDAIRVVFTGKEDSVLTTFERNGKEYSKMIYRYYFNDFKYKRADADGGESCKVLDGNIGYVNMGLLQPAQAKRYLKKLKNTKAIIFDVRNYPNQTMHIVADFLNTEKKPFAKFLKPDLSYPGLFRFTKPSYCGRRNPSAYTGKVILLFNETTQSHAEFTVMGLQTAPNVVSIGSQTAGADGNVTQVVFPGNYSTLISGLGVYYPDGRATQRIGIVPDIEVKPTIEGRRSGRDEVLEKAMEVINKGTR